MCTVTIIPTDAALDTSGCGAFRLVCNRDEARSRPAAAPPVHVVRGARHALFPIDTHAGGTWVGVNDAGLALALLNLNEPGAAPATFPASRGDIIPSLLSAASVSQALAGARQLTPTRYAPFRLLICDGRSLACIIGRPTGHQITRSPMPRQPVMFTSSGLGDHIVRTPRRELFHDWFSTDRNAWPAEQDAYHAHRWSDRPEVSVLMSRPAARTVSRTSLDVTADLASMHYTPLLDGVALTPHILTLLRGHAGVETAA